MSRRVLSRYIWSFCCAHPFLMELQIRLVTTERAIWRRGKVEKANGNEWVDPFAFSEANGNTKNCHRNT